MNFFIGSVVDDDRGTRSVEDGSVNSLLGNEIVPVHGKVVKDSSIGKGDSISFLIHFDSSFHLIFYCYNTRFCHLSMVFSFGARGHEAPRFSQPTRRPDEPRQSSKRSCSSQCHRCSHRRNQPKKRRLSANTNISQD